MYKTMFLIILVVVLLIAGCQLVSSPAENEGTRVGDIAPDFELANLDGEIISLSDLRGSPVLLNFWATWCPPCREEMPYLQQVYQEWSPKGLELLTVNIGESSSSVKGFLEANELSLPVLLDSTKEVADWYNITAIPVSLFIDEEGVIRVKIIGAFPSKRAIEQSLTKIIP